MYLLILCCCCCSAAAAASASVAVAVAVLVLAVSGVLTRIINIVVVVGFVLVVTITRPL